MSEQPEQPGWKKPTNSIWVKLLVLVIWSCFIGIIFTIVLLLTGVVKLPATLQSPNNSPPVSQPIVAPAELPLDQPTPQVVDPTSPASVVPVTSPEPQTTRIPIEPKLEEPASSSPLVLFGVYVAGCQDVSTIEKPGDRQVTLSIEVGGGNDLYRYFFKNNGKWLDLQGKNLVVLWEAGTGWQADFAVESARERIEFSWHFNPGQMPTGIDCPR